MNPLPVIDLIGAVIFFIIFVIFFWRISKLKPPKVFFLLDFVCYKTPFAKPDPEKEPEKQTELYTSPNEVENVVYEMLDELLKKTKAEVKNIGVLVCMFHSSGSVSLSSMVMKRYKLKEDIASYDINGKGCTSGLMGVTLAKQLLQTNPDCCALVLTTEELPECLHVITATEELPENRHVITATNSSPTSYRPSGTAILLSNRTSDSPHAKYKLIGAHTVHLAPDPSPPPPPDPGTSSHVTITDNAASSLNVTSASSEKVARSSAAFLTTLVRGPRPHEFKLCQAGGDPMVGAAERNPSVGYQAEALEVVRSWFGYEPVTGLWYRFAEREAIGTRFEKGDWVSQMALWTDWSNFKGSTLVWEVIRSVDRREKKIKPVLFKLFGDINFRQYLPK